MTGRLLTSWVDEDGAWGSVIQKVHRWLAKNALPHLPTLVEMWPWILAACLGACGVFALLIIGLLLEPPPPQRWVIARGSRDPKTTDHSVVAEDGVVLRGISKGSGPTILLLHDAGGTSDIFSFLFKRFSLRGFRVIAFDLRGHGASDSVADFTPEQLALDLHLVLERLDLRDATVMGYGLGGYAALALAQHYPSTVATRVGRLVLLSAYPQTPREMRSSVGWIYKTALAIGIMHVLLRWRRIARITMRPFFGRHVTRTLEEEWRRAVLNCPIRVWRQGLNVGKSSE
jgi:pimeloyl-ACP methyl ester carboxylesterase